MHIWVHIWARKIWSSGVSLKRSCKMQFRRVGLRSIGPSSQKLQPNLRFGGFPYCNYNVKLQSGCTNWFMDLKCSKLLCVICKPSYIHFSLGRRGAGLLDTILLLSFAILLSWYDDSHIAYANWSMTYKCFIALLKNASFCTHCPTFQGHNRELISCNPTRKMLGYSWFWLE